MENSQDFFGFSDSESLREGESSTQTNKENLMSGSQTNEENLEDNNDDDVDEQSNDGANKKRAPIWRHFTYFVDENGRRYAICKHGRCTT